MFAFYVICAAIGCTLMIVQFILTLLGMGHDGDFDVGADAGDVHIDVGAGDMGDAHIDIDTGAGDVHAEAGQVGEDVHHGSSWFFGVLSFRALVAAVGFFGLAGVAGHAGELNPYANLVVAIGAGAAAMFVVAWLMRTLHSLKSEGTVHIENAIGAEGQVYLPIPGHKAGMGKVTIKIQSRTMEYPAVTADERLPTGTPIVVRGIVGSGTLEVESASKEKEN
jgi:hypothetical protein